MKTVLSCLLIGVFFGFTLSGCTKSRGELGTEKNPVKLYFVPSVDAKVIDANSKIFKNYLEKETNYIFQISTPQSFIAVVEAFGTKRADIAGLNTFGYALAHKKYGAQAKLTVIRFGLPTYQSQFVVRTDSQIKSLKDLHGKKIAYVDPASTSGYLIPLKTLNDHGIKTKESVFAMKHDSVISMVYQRQVDVGATYYSPPADGRIQDARKLVATQYPDIEQTVKILELSKPVPNDPIVFREGMPEEMKLKIIQAFKNFIKSEEGKKAFDEVFGATDLVDATDKTYEPSVQMFKELGFDIDQVNGK